MNISDFTLVVAVDEHHIKELALSYPTWIKHKKEISEMNKILIYDNSYFYSRMNELDNFANEFRLIPWDGPENVSQREKMLSSLVHAVADNVTTKWYLKLDTDALATNNSKWISDEWFTRGNNGKRPVIVSSPWGYTKPANALDILDNWANNIPYFENTEPLNIHHDPESNKVYSKRIISWLMIGDTAWTKEVASLCDGKSLPFPSQDTFLYYCATRTGEYINRLRMSKFGWCHIGRKFHVLENRAKELINV